MNSLGFECISWQVEYPNFWIWSNNIFYILLGTVWLSYKGKCSQKCSLNSSNKCNVIFLKIHHYKNIHKTFLVQWKPCKKEFSVNKLEKKFTVYKCTPLNNSPSKCWVLSGCVLVETHSHSSFISLEVS